MDIEQKLGADIAMCFDECAPYPCSYEEAELAVERTTCGLNDVGKCTGTRNKLCLA